MKLERNEKNKRKILFSPPDISEQEIEEAGKIRGNSEKTLTDDGIKSFMNA